MHAIRATALVRPDGIDDVKPKSVRAGYAGRGYGNTAMDIHPSWGTGRLSSDDPWFSLSCVLAK